MQKWRERVGTRKTPATTPARDSSRGAPRGTARICPSAVAIMRVRLPHSLRGGLCDGLRVMRHGRKAQKSAFYVEIPQDLGVWRGNRVFDIVVYALWARFVHVCLS